jgi:hypothetical protein
MGFVRHVLIFAFCALVCVQTAPAQSFTSGSTGADGAYSPTQSGDFDPSTMPAKCTNSNNVYNVCNFTTINIPANVTIKLRASKLNNQAITWLAQGAVTIAGTLDLSGASGGTLNTNQPAEMGASRILPEPGPGGYTGGLGALGGVAPQPGAGPGGGPAGSGTISYGYANWGGSGAFIWPGFTGSSISTGTTYGSYLAVPLYGGSGGGGGWDTSGNQLVGGVGGSGGGALRIASTTQITVNGTINANGGNGGIATGGTAGGDGGPGAGGTIHLVAPTITGTGTLTANSGVYPNYSPATSNGLIRFGTNNSSGFTGTASGLVLTALYLPPANSTLPLPSLSITSVNGVPVPPEASGSYLSPDVTIAATTAVNVVLSANNIPAGTIPTLRITAETGTDTVISCSALGSGNPAASTCSATFPYAISIAGVRATW